MNVLDANVNTPGWLQALWLGVFVYFIAGGLILYTTRSHQDVVAGLFAKAARLVPGFKDNLVASTAMYGFGPSRKWKQDFVMVVGWPLCVFYLSLLAIVVKRIERAGVMIQSSGGIYGKSVLEGRVFPTDDEIREEIIEERCDQVAEVFAPISMSERVVFADFFAKVFGPEVFNGEFGVESLALTLGAEHHGQTMEPGLGEALVERNNRKDIIVTVSFHRDVLVSATRQHEVEFYVAMQFRIARCERSTRGALVADADGQIGYMLTEWRRDFRHGESNPPFWEERVVAHNLNGLPLADDADEAAEKAWSEAMVHTEEGAVFDILNRMYKALNGKPAQQSSERGQANA